MASVYIKQLGERETHQSEEKYQYLLDNLNNEIPIGSINWYRDGTLCTIAVLYKDTIITVFASQLIEYEVSL